MPVTLRPPGFRPDLDALRAAITPRTRLILLNTPHNPTGAVFTRAELAAIAELACEHDLLVVTDEVYEHLVFDGEHMPIATLPGMRGAHRHDQLGGQDVLVHRLEDRLGDGTPELVTAVRTVKQFLTYVSGGPFQYAVAEALALPDAYFTSSAADLRAKRDLLCAGLADVGFEVYRPAGTYFITTDIAAARASPDGMEFCRELPRAGRRGGHPESVFYDDARPAGRRCASRSVRRKRYCGRRWPAWR